MNPSVNLGLTAVNFATSQFVFVAALKSVTLPMCTDIAKMITRDRCLRAVAFQSFSVHNLLFLDSGYKYDLSVLWHLPDVLF